MMQEDLEYGHVEILLDKYLKNHKISKNYLEQKANISRTQLLNYCNNRAQRIDLAVISRICHALNCTLEDLVVYIPPKR